MYVSRSTRGIVRSLQVGHDIARPFCVILTLFPPLVFMQSWAFFRVCCSIAIILDIVVFFASGITSRYTRCLYPIFIITR